MNLVYSRIGLLFSRKQEKNFFQEYHLDIRCWMAVASHVLRTLAEHYGEDASFVSQLDDDIRVLNDPTLLDQLHWSETAQRYGDYGLHSKSVHLKPEHRRRIGPNGRREEFTIYVRKVQEPPRLQLVDDVNGYVSLFPFLLQLLPPDSPKLEIILRQLNSSDVFFYSMLISINSFSTGTMVPVRSTLAV